MQLTSYGLSDAGTVRLENEDALFLDDEHQLYAVADGLGGLPGGAAASQHSVELLRQKVRGLGPKPAQLNISELMANIHRKVAEAGFEHHPFTGAGSTLTIGHIVDGQLRIGHIGDSAAYLLREERLEKLTTDHTMEQELIEREGAGARAYMPAEYPHTLTRCIGQGEVLEVDQVRTPVAPGDSLLLCSDGLNKVLAPAVIGKELAHPQSPKTACQRLVQMAKDQGSTDNITLIIVRFSGCL